MKYITDFNQIDLTKKYSYADYLTWRTQERIELIMGKIFKMSPAPKADHQQVSVIMVSAIYNHLKSKQCKVFSAPFDVRFPNDDGENGPKSQNVVQPDICVICDLTKIDDKGCAGAPDLIIEIVSKSSVRKDLHEKFDLYEINRVKEYWIVHPHDKTLTIFQIDENGKYKATKPLTIGDIAVSSVLIGFELNLDEVFEDLIKESEEPYGSNVRRL